MGHFAKLNTSTVVFQFAQTFIRGNPTAHSAQREGSSSVGVSYGVAMSLRLGSLGSEAVVAGQSSSRIPKTDKIEVTVTAGLKPFISLRSELSKNDA